MPRMPDQEGAGRASQARGLGLRSASAQRGTPLTGCLLNAGQGCPACQTRMSAVGAWPGFLVRHVSHPRLTFPQGEAPASLPCLREEALPVSHLRLTLDLVYLVDLC